MTDKPPRDMAASVRARLMKYAKEHGEAFDLVLIRFALERLLYRLSQSAYRDRFVVKGAIEATFDRRKTSLPSSPPIALTPEFYNDRQKSIQWNAFLKKSNLNSGNLNLNDVCNRLRDFIMLPSQAASRREALCSLWVPTKGWISVLPIQ